MERYRGINLPEILLEKTSARNKRIWPLIILLRRGCSRRRPPGRLVGLSFISIDKLIIIGNGLNLLT